MNAMWTSSWLTRSAEVVGAFAAAAMLSLIARRSFRRLARRAAVRAALSESRDGGRTRTDARSISRADAVARLIGRVVTSCAFAIACLFTLDRLGIDLVLAISSAGFLGLALALSGQGLIRDVMAGTRAMVEDRYAIGDRITARVAGADITGTVDLIAAASVRLRTVDGATCHVGHDAIDYLINHSQTPSTTRLALPAQQWSEIEPAAAATRLAASSNDIGLTGVVFVADIAGVDGDAPDAVTGEVHVDVNANRPLTPAQSEIVKQRLLDVKTS